MCVIIAGKGVDILEHVDDAMAANPHGAGVAWVTTDTSGGMPFRWRKGLFAPESVKALLTFINNGDAVFHARIGTAGGNTPELTHPFPVEIQPSLALEGESDMLLFQNGHLPSWETLLGGTPRGPDWNDTRAIAHSLATGLLAFGEDIGSKILVLHNLEGEPQYTAYGSGWIRLGRVLASNDHHIGYSKRRILYNNWEGCYSGAVRSGPYWDWREDEKKRRDATLARYRYPERRKYHPSCEEIRRLPWRRGEADTECEREEDAYEAMRLWYSRA